MFTNRIYTVELIAPLRVGTYTDVAIWTSIEPSVGLISCCLPTLRPLLREIWHWGEHFRTIGRSFTPTQQNTGIKLESGNKSTQKVNSSHNARWIDNSLDHSSSQNSSRQTAVATLMREPDAERDDMLLIGVNVHRDVRVEHSPH